MPENNSESFVHAHSHSLSSPQHSQALWVGARTGEPARLAREQFREFCKTGSGYRTCTEGGVVHLCWPVPRRIARYGQQEIERGVAQAPQELEGQAEQDRAFRRCANLFQVDVSGERHFAHLGGSLLRTAEEAERCQEASPAAPLQLVQRPAAGDLASSQEDADLLAGTDDAAGTTHKRKSPLDTPAVMKQRRLLHATKLLGELGTVLGRVRASAKALAKQCKKKAFQDRRCLIGGAKTRIPIFP